MKNRLAIDEIRKTFTKSSEFLYQKRIQLFKGAAVLGFSLLLSSSLSKLDLTFLDSKVFHVQTKLGFSFPASEKIVLLSTADPAPLSTSEHTQIVKQLEDYQPAAVGYLFHLAQVEDIGEERVYADEFLKSIGRLEFKGTPVVIGSRMDESGNTLLPYPYSILNYAPISYQGVEHGLKMGQNLPTSTPYLYGRPTLYTLLAHYSNSNFDDLINPEDRFLFRIHGGNNPSNPYINFSIRDFLAGEVPKAALDNKVILIGYLEQNGDRSEIPSLLVHANIADSLISNDFLLRMSPRVQFAVNFVLVLAVLLCTLYTRPLRGLTGIGIILFASLLFAQVMFDAFLIDHGIWTYLSRSMVGIFLTYYLLVPYRLMIEHRKRWEYEQQKEVDKQVEELKSNFLSLITHDLKTPVARIHGLTEVLLSKASNRLKDIDKKYLTNIIQSTDELNHFISSILELIKIESNEFQISFISKDINTLIESSVKELKPLASAKGIQIRTKLEPLFPVKIDPALLKKVFNNIIDNAIKYSSPQSDIFIETREVGDFVEVDIRDQGIGMSGEETNQLFTKFYRAQNDLTTQVIGTGLGLYLSKYFVEAHFGKVLVESKPNEGTTFKILLPLELPEEKDIGLRTQSHREGSVNA